jgi:hypothetical protein
VDGKTAMAFRLCLQLTGIYRAAPALQAVIHFQ